MATTLSRISMLRTASGISYTETELRVRALQSREKLWNGLGIPGRLL